MDENTAQQLLEEMKEIKSNVASVQGDINNIENNMASMQGDINNIENNMASMQGDISNIENNMATVQDVNRIDNKLDSITEHVVRNSEHLSELTEKQNLKQLENIKDSQERQEKILETLALRSIEQESALKDHRAK